jgi:hypothetical protein
VPGGRAVAYCASRRADTPGGILTDVASLATVHFGLDSGMATRSPGFAAHNVALHSGVRITSSVIPTIGDTVEKSGRTIHVTDARVQGIGRGARPFVDVIANP